MEELIKELREYAKHAQWQAPGKAAALLEAAEVIAMEGLDGYADQLRLMAEGE